MPVSPWSGDVLIRCSEPGCPELIYLDESIKGRLIDREMRGRYCLRCAHVRGYFTKADIETLRGLLEAAGMTGRWDPSKRKSKVTRPQPSKTPGPDQGVLL